MSLISVAACAADDDGAVRVAQYQRSQADAAGGIGQLLIPGSPVPKIGRYATQVDYIRWAENALSRGQDAEAELSLEWAQLRSRMDEDEAAYRADAPPPPYDSFCQRALCKAMRAIGRGRDAEGERFIAAAIADALVIPRPAGQMAAR